MHTDYYEQQVCFVQKEEDCFYINIPLLDLDCSNEMMANTVSNSNSNTKGKATLL